MMHATKETCIIPLAAIAIAAVLTMRPSRKDKSGAGFQLANNTNRKLRAYATLSATALALGLLVAFVVSVLFFSSFGSNPRGVIDSFATYAHYIQRATGQGSAGRHDHAAGYYLRILFWWKHASGPIWTEASIAAFALVGSIAAVLGRGLKPGQIPLARFLVVFTLTMTIAYSAISYKTPWCALGFLHGMILLAGVGIGVLVRIAPTYPLKCAALALTVAAVAHLTWQSWQANFVAYDAPGNPYVYAHTTADIPVLADRLTEVAAGQPNHEQVAIQVICSDNDYWPLPWYLRHVEHVGWHNEVPKGAAAPVIVIQVELEPALVHKLYEEAPPGQRYLYMPLAPSGESRDWQLRPHVPLRAYIRSDLWERQTGETTATIR